MKRNLMKLTLIACIGFLLLPSVLPVMADLPEEPEEISGLTNVTGFMTLLTDIGKWIFQGVILIAVILIIVAGFNFLTAGGSPEKIATARQMLIYALVGIAVALLAYTLPVLINAILGG